MRLTYIFLLECFDINKYHYSAFGFRYEKVFKESTDMKGKKDCIKYTKPFIYYNIPLLLEGLVVIERLMPILFKAFRASFGMMMVIEISRIVSRVLILLAYCYIGITISELN